MNSTSIDLSLTATNESTWMRMGVLAELMHESDQALYCYENALRHNPHNAKALTQVAYLYRLKEDYEKAIYYFQRILNMENTNGEIWGALGHCYLLLDELQKAYTAYQQALYHLPQPKDPNLWYGIGILYERYGSHEHAEEAFAAVLKMNDDFEKANEIHFRLGLIYKQQRKYEQSLECLHFILDRPPPPMSQGDIWFQIGHVRELQRNFSEARSAYEKALEQNPRHAKVLQQLGWLIHNSATSQEQQDMAIKFLTDSIEADSSDGQTWYMLGRCWMTQQKYKSAYDAYQQAVYRDARVPAFWCSIGVLYYQISQYRDALDAYSRAIRLNPYMTEVWYDLGTLYESCDQINDALDAYRRAAELDPNSEPVQQRLYSVMQLLHSGAESKQMEPGSTLQSETQSVPVTMEPRDGMSQTSTSVSAGSWDGARLQPLSRDKVKKAEAAAAGSTEVPVGQASPACLASVAELPSRGAHPSARESLSEISVPTSESRCEVGDVGRKEEDCSVGSAKTPGSEGSQVNAKEAENAIEIKPGKLVEEGSDLLPDEFERHSSDEKCPGQEESDPNYVSPRQKRPRSEK